MKPYISKIAALSLITFVIVTLTVLLMANINGIVDGISGFFVHLFNLFYH